MLFPRPLILNILYIWYGIVNVINNVNLSKRGMFITIASFLFIMRQTLRHDVQELSEQPAMNAACLETEPFLW
jgi:hypothetical protein